MASCKKFQNQVHEYVDGSLPLAAREAVERHLRHCPACAGEAEACRRLRRALSSVPERRVSDAFEANLATALRETAPAPSAAQWWERFRLRYEWRFRVPAMAAAGGLAVAILAAVAVPPLTTPSARAQARRQYLTRAVERHQQLEDAGRDVDWEAVDASIALSTGSVLTE